jgi:hypothetical protein
MARKLREMNNNIIIGAGNDHLSFFRNELPEFTLIPFSGFRPGYSRFLPQYLSLLLKTPILLYHIIREHSQLKKIIREHNVDIVISDNRFGLWNTKVTSVYITHMPLIPFPKSLRSLEFIGVYLHSYIIKKYSLCFIPDLEGEMNFTGRLSHSIKLPDNVRYIGILSRFSIKLQASKETGNNIYNTVILSGPEPQREILKQKLAALFFGREPVTVILEGKPGNGKEKVEKGNITYYNHLSESEMNDLITGSKTILTRSGYTTIMELISLNCSALLIPTPGQTEQEYLAEYLSEKGWFSTLEQSKINEGILVPVNRTLFPGFIVEQSNVLLAKALEELLK